MSSKTAQEKFNGGMNDYRYSEGRSFLLDYRGPVKETIQDILGGLRSCGTYIGCERIEDFEKNIRFIRVTQQLNNPYDSRGSAPWEPRTLFWYYLSFIFQYQIGQEYSKEVLCKQI